MSWWGTHLGGSRRPGAGGVHISEEAGILEHPDAVFHTADFRAGTLCASGGETVPPPSITHVLIPTIL